MRRSASQFTLTVRRATYGYAPEITNGDSAAHVQPGDQVSQHLFRFRLPQDIMVEALVEAQSLVARGGIGAEAATGGGVAQTIGRSMKHQQRQANRRMLLRRETRHAEDLCAGAERKATVKHQRVGLEFGDALGIARNAFKVDSHGSPAWKDPADRSR